MISAVSELNVSVPTTLEVEALEVDLVDVNVSLEADGLDGVVWETVWVVAEMVAVDRDLENKEVKENSKDS